MSRAAPALGLGRRRARLLTPDRSIGTELAARAVSVDLGGRRILAGVDLTIGAGEVVALVGPNGAGKSTLLHTLTGDLAPAAGEVTVDGRPLADWSSRELAMRRSVLPQQVAVSFPFTAREVVLMGRAPWLGTIHETADDEAVDEALAATDTLHLAARGFPTLSGGERARVALARVLAQRTRLILLDEPTAALDLHHQETVLAIARGRAAEGDAVVAVLHDLGLAAAYADRVAVISDGRIVADGPPASVLDPALLSAVYDHPIEVVRHPVSGALLVLPVRW